MALTAIVERDADKYQRLFHACRGTRRPVGIQTLTLR